MIIRGYEKTIISEKINSFFALPFFLALMTILAAIFTINNRNSNNINYLMTAVLTCAVIYYMKDLSVAKGPRAEDGIGKSTGDECFPSEKVRAVCFFVPAMLA